MPDAHRLRGFLRLINTVLDSVNPKCEVPTLQYDEGDILTEGPTIVQYVADQAPATKLPPGGDTARYHVQEWLNFTASELSENFYAPIRLSIRARRSTPIGARFSAEMSSIPILRISFIQALLDPIMTCFLRSSLALALLLSGGTTFAQNVFPSAGMRAPGQAMPQAQIVQGRNFTYMLPAGWRVVEEGNHALVLQAYDMSAGVIVYGVSGFGQNLTPPQFAYSAITNNLRLAPDVRISNPTPIQPMPGYTAAAVMDIAFTKMGPQGPQRVVGLVISNVVSVYARSDAVVTLMLALDSHWRAVQSWLPHVALQALNTGPNPFGRTAMSGNILNDTVRQREAYGQYLNWSQANWAGVVAHRAASLDRQAQAIGETLTGQYWGRNPYTGAPERYSTSPSVIWVHRDGRQIPSSNSTFDPRTPTDSDWRRVQR